MDHFVEKLEIKNFKSIRDLTLTGFRRINLFIGRPNVGKSNLLEALGMFSLWNIDYVKSDNFARIFRAEKPSLLFFDGNHKFENGDQVRISATLENDQLWISTLSIDKTLEVRLTCRASASSSKVVSSILNSHTYEFDNLFNRTPRAQIVNETENKFKKYIFDFNTGVYDSPDFSLSVPFGNNLMDVLGNHSELRKTIAGWFKEYNLRLVLDRTSNSLKIQKEVGENEVFILPYSMIADTLQRLIFYKTAVASNQNSVLIFEEPEAHAYPPYIAEFTQEVIKSETNQFFIATHSPIVVNDFLENAREDLSIFMTDFKDGQTVARALTRKELEEVYDYGIDLFFNNEAYVV